MTWTYSPALTAPRDQVRYRIGDTAEAEPLLSDEELAYCISTETGLLNQAAAAAEAIAAKFARDVDHLLGTGMQTQSEFRGSQRYDHYVALAATLREQARYLGGRPTAGGVSRGTKQRIGADSDATQPSFTRSTGVSVLGQRGWRR